MSVSIHRIYSSVTPPSAALLLSEGTQIMAKFVARQRGRHALQDRAAALQVKSKADHSVGGKGNKTIKCQY